MTENVPVFEDQPLPAVQRYTSVPVTIEALQLTEESYFRVFEWIEEHKGSGAVGEARTNVAGSWSTDGLFIPTPEGTMRATFGNWIIRGTMGEFYPCKDEVFQAKYRKADS